MAVCSSNSTECLLRAILNAQNTFDWNPASFGATVALGFLALLIAITTVFQATLGASPGRLKASKRAIGPFYSKTAKTRFSPTELRFRTIAWVPFIDQIEWCSQKSSDTVGEPINSIYGAGWLNLIQPIPIECQKWFATPCQTDYLPADILAAPARASVGAIVQLAVLGGCDSVEIVRDFPLVKGRGAQLSFREHPYLGCIAIFDQYLYGMQSYSGPEALQKRDLLYLKGQMSFQGVFVKALLFDGKSASQTSTQSMSVIEALHVRRKCNPKFKDQMLIEDELNPGKPLSLILGLLTWDSLRNCKGLPYSKICIRRATLSLVWKDATWHSMNKSTILRSLYNLLSINSTILAYDTTVPHGTGIDVKQQHTMLGWTWLIDDISKSSIDQKYIDVLPETRLSEDKRPWFEWRPGGMITEGSRTLTSGDGNLLIFPAALDICLVWLESGGAFQEIATDEKDEARSILGYQLHEVDFWLLKHGGVRSADCVFQLLSFSPDDSYFPGRRYYPWGRERYNATPKTLITAWNGFSEIGVGEIADHRQPNLEPLGSITKDSQKNIIKSSSHYSTESLRLDSDNREDLVFPDEISIPESPEAPSQLPRLLTAPGGIHERNHKIPPNARWTKINRRLVNPQALEAEGLDFIERPEHVIVLSVLTRNEIQTLAELTYYIRQKKAADKWLEKRDRKQIVDSKHPSNVNDALSQSSHESNEITHTQSTNSLPIKPHNAENTPTSPLPIPSQSPPPNTHITPPNPSQETNAKADAGMKTLLVYRAILFATLGALAADTSCVFESELGRRIVQVL